MVGDVAQGGGGCDPQRWGERVEFQGARDEAFRVLSPGSPVALETINVASWSAFFTSYIRDLTHVRPIHPDTLKFVVVASGFLDAEIQLRAPLPEGEKLKEEREESRSRIQALEGQLAEVGVKSTIEGCTSSNRKTLRMAARLD